MNALLRSPAYFAAPDDADLTGNLSDTEITNALAEAGVDDALLEAAVYAVRNGDFGYLVRTYERQAAPVVQQYAETQAASDAADAAEARDEWMRDASALG